MSSFDKVVKLACKPKAAPPKPKYLESIIAATWSDDGAVHDVCKALSPRFREPNAIVVFKALIVLHTMIRNGATDNVLSYLSTNEILRLSNVSAGNWEGYAAPENLQNYATYLDARIRAYRDLKHDAVRVQAETNRDMRNSHSIEADTLRTRKQATPTPTPSGPQRSKTITGRKLRVMTVEKGLLRETKAVHRMIDTLVECRFYLDNLEDELTTTALRMLVKDLLILFQAGNEGVINVLEHYFEMSHVDAKEALAIYRHFCTQTERVVEFLGVAKKLQNLLNVPIPNLKHAPVSLVGALEEYIEDPNFEQNRIEYRTNKEAVDRGNKKPTPASKANTSNKTSARSTPLPTQPSPSANVSSATPNPTANKDVVDFFSAIEEEQPTMFNPQTNRYKAFAEQYTVTDVYISPNTAYFQQQSNSNPFAQMQMMTGQPFMVPPQQVGFLHPQQTTFQIPPSNPFGLVPQQTGHRPFSTFLPSQQNQQTPQQTGFLQPQTTGANPFRQSMMFPQTTGMALFAANGTGGMKVQQTGQGTVGPGGPSGFTGSAPLTSTGMAFSATSIVSPFAQAPNPGSNTTSNLPTRPSSTPLTSINSVPNGNFPPAAQPVKTHQTGTKNPFGPIATAPPPVPRQLTLMELGMGVGEGTDQSGRQQPQNQQPSQPPQTNPSGFGFNSSSLNAGPTDISGVASSFAFNKSNANANSNLNSGYHPDSSGFSPSSSLIAQSTTTTTTGSAFSDSFFSSSLSSQPTGTTTASSLPSAPGPIKHHLTGFAGLKPFKPTSSFGASLIESLPAIPASSPTSARNGPASPGSGNSYGGSFGPNSLAFGEFSQTPTSTTSSTLGTGLRPQMTGGGAANPFRASMISPMGGLSGSSVGSSFTPSTSFNTPGTISAPFSTNAIGSIGGGAGTSEFKFNPVQQRQQNGSSSLI
ncbi:ANTH domain-containing protein [Collybia nuda]|uniref:ANTH domain-containing protein n=1 Tax=Collybia nuda TaxID=64659 RepID=A0A9P5YE74_9AGAR|nr:ANTH domain-containing protein [Collybia nuda]